LEERSKKSSRIMTIGLCCNVLLAAVKLFIGSAAASISILADAGNNLMDSLSSLTSLLFFRLSGRKADKEHPYGHGRYEYLAGVFVSVLVLFVGFGFLRSSVSRIFYPEQIHFSISAMAALLVSAVAKAVMGIVYLQSAKCLGSSAIRAAAVDCFSDVAVTLVTAVSFRFSTGTSLPLDGIAGVLVAIVVLISGGKMLLETLHPLLGTQGDPKLIANILALANSYEEILGVHDLLVHDYGPETTIVSLHAEMPDHLSFVECHRYINDLEKAAANMFSVSLLVHADPVDVTDLEVQDLHLAIKSILRSLDASLSYHDLQLDRSSGYAVLELDLVIPFGNAYNGREDAIRDTVTRELRRLDPDYRVLIRVERG